MRLVARSDEPLIYPLRKQRVRQNWLRFPAGSLSYDDAEAYTRWLDTTGKVPGARICDEWEWERAARGADEREWLHGNQLDPEDANFDLTYGRDPATMGPDEVGSFPASASPFGVLDMAGNGFEWASSRFKPGETLTRSGSYFFGSLTQRATNRSVIHRTMRDPGSTVRVCATYPSPERKLP